MLRLYGDDEAAEKAFRQALLCDPDAIGPRISLSYLLADQGRMDEMQAEAARTAAGMRRRLAAARE
jgi:hypothetical protein